MRETVWILEDQFDFGIRLQENLFRYGSLLNLQSDLEGDQVAAQHGWLHSTAGCTACRAVFGDSLLCTLI